MLPCLLLRSAPRPVDEYGQDKKVNACMANVFCHFLFFMYYTHYMYTPTIGIEVHAELKTKTKMFCGCANEPHTAEANANVCPVCMAEPGALPVVNRDAVEKVLMVGASSQALFLPRSSKRVSDQSIQIPTRQWWYPNGGSNYSSASRRRCRTFSA